MGENNQDTCTAVLKRDATFVVVGVLLLNFNYYNLYNFIFFVYASFKFKHLIKFLSQSFKH